MVVMCNDDAALRSLLPQLRRRAVTYGRRPDSDFRIASSQADFNDGCIGNRFQVRYRGDDLGEFVLRVPGAHNVLNATAAIAVGVGLDVPAEQIRQALDGFRGVDRRFQLRGKVDGISVVDDYGHHPTEIRATLAAARECGFRRVHVVFQPHRYTRTQLLMDQFATAFGDADSVFVLDIYPASEQPIPGVTAEALAQQVVKLGGKTAVYLGSFAEAASAAAAVAQEGDLILTLGAGNISQLAPQILQQLQARPQAAKITAG
jgi:UDP-N-acetylmuramate--alanine ligase